MNTTNSFVCNECPENTYSLGGNFRINGQLKEWKKENSFFSLFQSHCYVDTINAEEYVDEKCSSWLPSTDNAEIITGNPTITDSSYFTDLSMSFTLLKKGNVNKLY